MQEDTIYEEHDIKDTHDYQKERLSFRAYFALGVVLTFIGMMMFMSTQSSQEQFLDVERDIVLARQRERKAEKGESPFDDA